jgi:hypothetical protein
LMGITVLCTSTSIPSSTNTTSFSISSRTRYAMPATTPGPDPFSAVAGDAAASAAHETWNALLHLPFVHWMGAP